MRDMGIQGCRRGRLGVHTTQGDESLQRPADLVERQFRAAAPNRLWVADLTYVKTHSGWVYVAFIVDVFSRMIVGWQASRSLRADLAIDALKMATHNRGGTDSLEGLVHHSDRGVQYLAVRYSERLAVNDVVASVGSKGDSYDNALVESYNGLYKWELIYPEGPLGRARRRRVGDPHLRRLVQPAAPPRRDHRRPQLHHPRQPSRPPTTVRPPRPPNPGHPTASTKSGAPWLRCGGLAKASTKPRRSRP
jgi:transposase InsO family protein